MAGRRSCRGDDLPVGNVNFAEAEGLRRLAAVAKSLTALVELEAGNAPPEPRKGSAGSQTR